ncbi:hypothetical protein J2801_003606 [Paraburkholderia phenoliruptrix]|uniref:hypothetical protein n=1 Tax=Paraburkholderia phenoliruptrix TaxID=252970 RepID=UPI002861DE39|nr:hypothetical protein [Paraburkholderia phenoliruptrix]MDR6421318.1 hypothetical protein [Paraburkholderia phenoliruptrix]
MFVADLAGFSDGAVLKALSRCRREVRGVLTVSDVVSRIDDGRPGPEEAWAMLPRDEDTTVVWTDEMRAAWAIARPMLEADEDIPARMAFKEAYVKAVSEARENRTAVQWQVSLGHDRDGREQALKRAVELGRLSSDQARKLIPVKSSETSIGHFLITGDAKPLLEATSPEQRGNVEAHLNKLKEIVGGRLSK